MLATDMRCAYSLPFLGLLLISPTSIQAQSPSQNPAQSPAPNSTQSPEKAPPGRNLEQEIDSLQEQIRALQKQAAAKNASVDRTPTGPAKPARDAQTEIKIQDPEVSSSVDLKIWGRVVFNMTYDNFAGLPNVDFQNYVVAEGPDTFNFNPRDSRLGFGASQSWDDWNAGAVIEIDFYGGNVGNNILPRIRLGYAHVGNEKAGFSLRAGQDWTPVASQNPGTIDFGILAWGGNLWWRVPQFTARQELGDHLEVLLSAMKHRIANTMEAEERMPWLLGKLSYKDLLDEGKGLLAISIGGRKVKIQGNRMDAWLMALEWNLPLHRLFSINGEMWTGQGIGDEFLRYNLAYNLATGTAIRSSGGFFSIRTQVTDQLQFNAGLGIDDPSNGQTGAKNAFHRNQIGFVNAQYKFTKHFGMGFEFMDLKTQSLSDEDLRGQRYTFSTWFVF